MIDQFFDHLAVDQHLGVELRYRAVLPPERARFELLEPPLPSMISDGLERLGINGLYSHQAQAISAVRRGEDVVVVTPTASGKTLTYLLPVLESLTEDSEQSVLLLFPLKALEQDQFTKLQYWTGAVRETVSVRAEIYDGDTAPSLRRKIRRNPPQFLITNPDMMHYAILAHHQGWESFLRRLKYIVIDELHAYRGVFGSQILQVFRRFSRLLTYYGTHPQIIALSATIANPLELAEKLTQRNCTLVNESGAPRSGRHVAFVNASVSMSTAVARLFIEAVDRGLRTIIFSKARVATEVIHRIVIDHRPDLAHKISVYRAGFLARERREIEAGLFRGDLLGVIATSALELGIDIGGLDLCILAGYPGSIMSFWQRSGRVGRRDEESGIILVAGSDALDQYFLNNPDALFARGFEHALVNEENEEILKGHLPSAAAEIPLMRGDPHIDVERHREVIDTLEREGALLRSGSGNQWFSGRPRPHSKTSLRSIGGTFDIQIASTGKIIGEISGGSVFRECHDGAIYLHGGEQYLVQKLDLARKSVHVEPVTTSNYTMVRSDKETEIIDERNSKIVRGVNVHLGKVKVTETYHSYERRRLYSQELLSVEPLDLPPYSYVTSSAWIDIPGTLQDRVSGEELHVMGGIHAMEHAAISLIPLFALCDRSDVGGISFTRHKQLPAGGVFFYDGYPGGIGIAEKVFDAIEDLVMRTRRLIQDCSCIDGCPSCIQSPKCGSGNKPLDKQAALLSLELLISQDFETLTAAKVQKTPELRSTIADWVPISIPADRRVLVMDLETQRSAEEVGGWSNARQMRVAVGAVWDSIDGLIHTYDEAHVEDLLDHLRRADLVVGYNILGFDYEVLRGYTFERLHDLPTLDLCSLINQTLGKRLKLDTLAKGTLGMQKSADGLQSLKWFKEGRIDLVREYCMKDVDLTRQLLEFALEHGYVVYDRKDHGKVRIPIDVRAPFAGGRVPESVEA